MVNKAKVPWWKKVIKLGEYASTPGIVMNTEESSDDIESKRLVFTGTPKGSFGTDIQAGYIYEDYLHELQGHKRADIFDKMRRSDPQISMCLSAVKNPILSAPVEIEPADDSPEAAKMADFVKFVLFEDMEDTFAQFMVEATTCIDFGFAGFEMTDKVVMNHPEWGTYNGLKQLSWRSPRTIHRFNVDPKTGRLLSITQYAYGDIQRLVDIPAEYLLLLTVQREGANYEGISMLRKCYGNWFRKDHYMKMNAIGIEKFAIPTPIADIPPGAQGTDQYAALIEALEVYTTHQANYLTKPAGWVIDFNNGVYDPEKVEKSIDAEDRRMVKAFLANFLELGMGGSGGAYALSNDLSDFFLGGIKYFANTIAEGLNRVIIPRLIKMNYGPQAKYPKLKFTGIDDKAGQEFANMLKSLADSQYITPDDQTEEHLRKRIGLPKMSKIGQRAVMAKGALGAPGPANPAPPATLSERIKLAEQKRLAKK